MAWGANHNWGEVQHGRRLREGENPVPHYWDHVMWVWGQDDIEEFMKVADQVTLEDVADKITVPFLITHGINDRQINVKYAHQSYEQAVNSPKRELRIFTPEEGGTEHISLDNLPVVASFIADWVAETFTELDARSLKNEPTRHDRRGHRSVTHTGRGADRQCSTSAMAGGQGVDQRPAGRVRPVPRRARLGGQHRPVRA